MIGALGVYIHQLWLMWLGAGVIGGVGLGLGYISPVSTLIKWFPDRRGMATGMAIMGFGGGAMIGSPLDHLDERLPRRRLHVCASLHRPVAHAFLERSAGNRRRRLADLHRNGCDLFRLHADRRLRVPAAAARLAA